MLLAFSAPLTEQFGIDGVSPRNDGNRVDQGERTDGGDKQIVVTELYWVASLEIGGTC